MNAVYNFFHQVKPKIFIIFVISNCIICSAAESCPNLVSSVGLKLECYNGSVEIDCNGTMQPNTRVLPKCVQPYVAEPLSKYRYIYCRYNGQWDQTLFKCVAADISDGTIPVRTMETTMSKPVALPLSTGDNKPCDSPSLSPGRKCSVSSDKQLRLSCDCDTNYTLRTTEKEAYCIGGRWFPEVPKCVPLCPVLTSATVNFVSCTYGMSNVPCTEPAKPNTIVRIECKPSYVYVDPSSVFRSVVCRDDGTWDHPLYKCRPDCGLPYPGTEPLIIGGRRAKPNEVPWHVAVYRKEISGTKVGYRYICGGTIISPLLIVSAAHCFTDSTTGARLPAENYKIAVAKITVQYNNSDDDSETRIFGVTKLHIPDDYQGEEGSYHSDIALIELDSVITMSYKIMPICIDWSPPSNSKPPNIGTIAGWGTTENETVSDVLLIAQLPFISRNECRSVVHLTSRRFVNLPDKFCAGSLTGPSARQGDSGGGWMYQKDGHYFIYGTVSFRLLTGNSVTLFTGISFHLDWMDRIRKDVEQRRGH